MSMAAFWAGIDATWPPARHWDVGPFSLRQTPDPGNRANAARVSGDWTPTDLDAALAAQAQAGQAPQVIADDADTQLAAALESRGLVAHDRVAVLAAPTADFVGRPLPRVGTFTVWPPLAIQTEIWSQSGTPPERLAIMDRVTTPKTTILGRINDRAAGTAFVALSGTDAQVHSLVVVPEQRQQGMAGQMVTRAAQWAAEQGATRIMAPVLRHNPAAMALWRGLGFAEIGGYICYRG